MPSKDSPVYSVIDIGTNTCLLLIAILKEKSLTKLFEAQEAPRLGKDLYETGNISEEAFQNTLEIIKRYISISKKYNSEKILAFGTSALRDAKNNKNFVEFIKKETSIKIKIISGIEEAKYSYEGAVFDLEKGKEYAVLDIGGGSTEMSFMKNNKIKSFSINIGSVRIHEEFFKGNLNEQNIFEARKFIQENINKINFKIENKILVGVAGTMTTLSAIKNNLQEFKEEVIHKDTLRINEIKNIFERLISMNNSERLNLGSFMKGRSDIIICGALVLIETMKNFNIDKVVVSTKGLRYGMLLNLPDFN